MKELGDLGIKTTYIMSPDVGIVANSSYWAVAPPTILPILLKTKWGLRRLMR